MFKKVIATVLLMCAAVNAKPYSVCVIKAADIKALDAVVDGIDGWLRKRANIKVESCQGNAALASQIVSKNAEVDVIVTVGTLPTQVACKLAESGKCKAKIIFTAVTDPSQISALIRDGKVTGVSDHVSVKTQLEWIVLIQPKLKKIGIIYNAGEANSVASLDELKQEAKKFGIELVEKSIQKTSDIQQAANAIAQNVDAIFVNNDNTVLSGLPLIVKTCREHKIPVYVSDTDEMQCGCAAACGPDQYVLGYQTAKLIDAAVKGKNAKHSGFEAPKVIERHINIGALRNIGLSPTEQSLKEADQIIDDNE
jgi:putative ABC transport system substrate-binding protein